MDKKEWGRAEGKCSGHRVQSHMGMLVLFCSDMGDLPVNKVRLEVWGPFATLLLWQCGESDGSVRRVRVPLLSLEGESELTPSPCSCRGEHCSPVSFLPAGPIPSITGP